MLMQRTISICTAMIDTVQAKKSSSLLKVINPESRFYHLFDCVPRFSF